jgi:rod shape-determining protein MreD
MLVVAVILQFSFVPSIAIFGAKPDLILLVLMLTSCFHRPGASAAAGFFVGILQGALAGANMLHYVTSRCIGAFVTSLLRNTESVPDALITIPVITGTTLLAQFLLMFFAPPTNIGLFIRDTITMALYNGVIALPLFALVRRIARPKKV